MKFLALILLLVLPSFAQDQHPIDVQFDKDVEKNNSTHGLVAAYNKALESWDKELNKQYQKLMAGLDADAKASLKESQRAWIAYRDKETKNLGEFYSKVSGTMFQTIYAAAVTNLTKNRALSLSYMADFVDIREK
ncbi:DUF1311 domain-containing protein [Akkermansiaceae bacterium]|jgi:uncharacterized protein YecT (DUF1311 family)|nr:DUF1311 domain-containing protein [Akkermansiaceae bacterium]